MFHALRTGFMRAIGRVAGPTPGRRHSSSRRCDFKREGQDGSCPVSHCSAALPRGTFRRLQVDAFEV